MTDCSSSSSSTSNTSCEHVKNLNNDNYKNSTFNLERVLNTLNTMNSTDIDIIKSNCAKTKASSAAKQKTKSVVEKPEITFNNYIKNNIVWRTYKIPQLKHAAKINKLHITGSKQVLIVRITEFFTNTKHAINIQKTFRRHIVRFSTKLRGPALHNLKMCVNDTDFVTLEPLDEIPKENFFSYSDDKNFTYGFNISSVVNILKKNLMSNDTLNNPYNRETIPEQIISNAISLYRITYIVYPEFRKENENFVTNKIIRRYTISPPSVDNLRNAFDDNHVDEDNQHPPLMNRVYRPRLITNYTTNQNNYNRYNMLQSIRTRPIHQRINDLFMEIDQLGNYTQASWFSTLDLRSFYRLYRSLYDIWSYRAGLSFELKIKICPFHGPFDGVFSRTPRQSELSIEEIKMACLIVMENMIYSGVDDDHRKIGCLHALSGLTIVSHDARTAIPWLYESVMY